MEHMQESKTLDEATDPLSSLVLSSELLFYL
jgi:hypothetical protein